MQGHSFYGAKGCEQVRMPPNLSCMDRFMFEFVKKANNLGNLKKKVENNKIYFLVKMYRTTEITYRNPGIRYQHL
jgi:hypothetical protein